MRGVPVCLMARWPGIYRPMALLIVVAQLFSLSGVGTVASRWRQPVSFGDACPLSAGLARL